VLENKVFVYKTFVCKTLSKSSIENLFSLKKNKKKKSMV